MKDASVFAACALLLAGCRCSFDSATLDDLACTDGADCAPDQDCVAGTCAQRRCGDPSDCGVGFSFTCDEEGFCVAAGCSAPEDCSGGLVCVDGFCRSPGADAGEPDASLPDASLPDASLPDASLLDASLPDASLPDASVGCAVDPDCDDGVFCNGQETCAGGLCAGGAPPCPPGGACNTSVCDEAQSSCRLDPVPDGTGCDDGSACTYGDGCSGGACASVPYSCDDGLACTSDLCDGRGACSNALDGGSCAIAGTCWLAGEADPFDGCRECAPADSPFDWTLDCGLCPRSCAPLEQCVADRCAPAPFGTGEDGDSSVALGDSSTIGTAATAATGSAGGSTLGLADATGFAPGQVVLVHQTQGTGAGDWELARISSIAVDVATLAGSLQHSYSNVGVDRAQVIVVPQYRDLIVDGTLTAPAWNGATGGVLAFAASGTVTVNGAIDMVGRGFRGAGHACIYQCQSGFSGESSAGPGVVSQAANGAGGGGGTAGQDCGMGGGGGHGSAGGAGGDGINVFGGCGLAPLGGQAGGTVGAADLDAAIHLGAAGGEGGGDEDGGRPGAGGNGGGIVVIFAAAITVTGAISADGSRGADGDSLDCGTGGCGMSGGGGGAGGGIRIVAGTADLGDDLVHTLGGDSGLCTCGGAILTGIGGVGRIEATATVLSGNTNPP